MTTLLTIISVALEAINVSLLINIFLKLMNKEQIQNNTKKICICFCCLIGTIVINNLITLYLPSFLWLKSILFLLGNVLITFCVYKTSIFKCFFTATLTSLVPAFLNIIFALVIKLFGYTPEEFISTEFNLAISTFVITLGEFLIYLILKLIYKFKQNRTFSFLNARYMLPQAITLIVCMLPTMILLMLNDFEDSIIFIIVNFIQLLIISAVSIYNTRQAVKHERTQLKLDNTLSHNQTLMKVNEGVRGFKHDMTNIVQSILGYLACKDISGARAYCENLVVGFNDINVLSILSPAVINEPALYGVVTSKILIAREKNLNLSLDVNLKVNEINFPKFELSRTLGILLDNAIEAAENTKDKNLVLNMRVNEDETLDIITVSNSISDTNIDICKMFEKNYSTKENPSGFGLYEITKFLNKYTQANITTSIDSKAMMLSQTLTIKKKKINKDIEDLDSNIA